MADVLELLNCCGTGDDHVGIEKDGAIVIGLNSVIGKIKTLCLQCVVEVDSDRVPLRVSDVAGDQLRAIWEVGIVEAEVNVQLSFFHNSLR